MPHTVNGDSAGKTSLESTCGQIVLPSIRNGSGPYGVFYIGILVAVPRFVDRRLEWQSSLKIPRATVMIRGGSDSARSNPTFHVCLLRQVPFFVEWDMLQN